MDDQACLFALGGNQPSQAGPPEATLAAALQSIASVATVRAVSKFYRTPCFPAGAGPDFVTACAVLDHDGPPVALLDVLHAIEANFGRERRARWSERTLDLDLLAVGNRVLPDVAGQDHWRNLPPEDQARLAPDRLILPHPRMQDRAFVLVPLCDVAPDWRHPRLGLTVRQMRDRLPQTERAAVVPMQDPEHPGGSAR